MIIKGYQDWLSLNEEKDSGYYTYNHPSVAGSIYRKLKTGNWRVLRPGMSTFQNLTAGDVAKRIENLESRAVDRPLRLLFVGDSNTASTTGGMYYGWWINNILNESSLFSFSAKNRVEIERLAKHGEATQWMIDNLTTKLASVQKGFYDIITILGGSNDIWGGNSDFEKVKTNIKKLVKLAEDHGATAVVVSPPSKLFYTPRGESKEGDQKLDELKKLVDWEKATYPGRFIDFNLITSPEGGATAGDFEADKRHLKPEPKHKELAEKWIEIIYWGTGPV